MDLKTFFDLMRGGLMGPRIDNDELHGSKAILEALEGLPVSWAAYALATAWHETAHTMRPIKEYGGSKYFFRMYDPEGKRPHVAKELGNKYEGDGAKFAGRGYVQLTGRRNYIKAGKKLGIPEMVDQPELALRSNIAASIMRIGMVEGWFTGKGFAKYLPENDEATKQDFMNARRIINGKDKASLIADYAKEFQNALIASGWKSC